MIDSDEESHRTITPRTMGDRDLTTLAAIIIAFVLFIGWCRQADATPMPPALTFVCIYSRIEDGSVECYDTLFAIASVTDCNIDGAPITADNGGPGTMVVTFDGVGEAIIFAYNDRSWQSDTPGQGQVTLNVFSGIPPWDTPRRCPTYTHP